MASQDSNQKTQNITTLKPTKETPATFFGWPATGGVWVLKPTLAELKRTDLPVTNDMEEHCAMLKSLGGTFYQDPNDCEEVREMKASIPPTGKQRLGEGKVSGDGAASANRDVE
ncbi:hypothetical protein B0T16DRAFT_458816 [Cercophora newfieldiana]|uniref:Uncharacterized protein n=1 Tax=Cercophora newfieldiana TaxID=92897 RepID=A0AA40CRX8_9PEZI|nr:hypothetical protein B0T16DRAFT_458816 [Cercophora newfieldiana]